MFTRNVNFAIGALLITIAGSLGALAIVHTAYSAESFEYSSGYVTEDR